MQSIARLYLMYNTPHAPIATCAYYCDGSYVHMLTIGFKKYSVTSYS